VWAGIRFGLGKDVRPGAHPHAALDFDQDARTHQFGENPIRGRLRDPQQALKAWQIEPGAGILDDMLEKTPEDLAANMSVPTLGRHAVASLQLA
jgi:hypothetical protein